MKARGQGRIFQRGQVWWAQYSVRGRQRRESSGSTKRADAVRLLKQRIAESVSGKPMGLEVDRTTLGELAAMLIADYEANGRRTRVIKSPLAHLERFFGDDCRANEMTSDRLSSFVNERRIQGAANATINRSLAALKRAFALAERAGKVSHRPYFPMLTEHNRRKGFFERSDYEALIKQLPDYLRPAVQTAYITGWRVTPEILTRRKRDVDLEGGWLRLEPGETKNKEGRNFPLIPELRSILEQQLGRTRALEIATGKILPWLFHHDGNRIRNFRRAWLSACKRAGLVGRIPHDFRRSAVRNLERAGVPRSAAMAMVGHKTQAIYSRYAIADEAMLREGAQKLAALHASDLNQQTAADRIIPLAQSPRATS